MQQNDAFLCQALGSAWLKLGAALKFPLSMAQCNCHDLRAKQKVASQLLAQCVIYCKSCPSVKKVSGKFVTEVSLHCMQLFWEDIYILNQTWKKKPT